MNRRRFVMLVLACLSMVVSGIQPALLTTTPAFAKQATAANPGVTSIAFSPLLTRVAVGYTNGDIVIWDVESRSQVLVINAHPVTPVSGLAYDPAGKHLASAGRDSVVRIWEIETGNLVHELHGHAQPATSLAYSPDGTILASSGEDTRVLIWDVREGRLMAAATGHVDMVTDLVIHPDGTLVASGARNGSILISNLEDGETVQELIGHSGAVTSVDINDSGTALVSGGEDTTVRVWDLRRNEQVQNMRGHSDDVLDVKFRPDNGEATSAGADGRTISWDTEQGVSRRQTNEGAAAVTAIAYNGDGTLVAIGMFNGLTMVRDTATNRVLATFMYNPRPTNSQSDDAASDATLRSSELQQANLSTGPGGPILVVTPDSGPFTGFYAEILRTEGFNAFATASISTVTGSMLDPYAVVILAPTTLTSAQVTTFTNWVNAGGNLVAMRPDKQLASLLGLTDFGGVINNGYLRVVNTAAPGTGITPETIQFHGTADRYTTNGATAVAMLYSNATTSTNHPAVTLRQVGTNGGHAGAFTYDLARSVVLTRQGNTAWSGQDRDGFSPIRSNDLYYGAALQDPQSDWVDLNKVAIPQADEQMRLLSNMILHVSFDRMPIPRFWYFPDDHKAVVVMTGDDHGNNGTQAQFNTYMAMSPAGCSVEDWECVRATSYIFPNTPLSNQDAANFHAEGFEIGLHLNTFCQDYTQSSLNANFAGQLADWMSKYTSLPAPETNRTHCIAWSDWTTQASVSLAHGVRLDTNYYYWPAGWVADRPGFFTGTGMPMRFVDLNGQLIDVFHVTTQITDESGQSQPFTINSLLDRALGPDGYYGVFTVNAHTDMNHSDVGEAVVNSALDRGVPVISSKQLLTWVDGRNNSTFDDLTWNDSTLTFSVTRATGARGLRAMLPRQSSDGVLTSLKLNGNTVSFDVVGIKGVEYAVFEATGGDFVATYGIDSEPPTIIQRSPAPNANNISLGGNVTATFSEAMDPVSIDTTTLRLAGPNNTAVAAAVTYDASSRTAILDPSGALARNTTYTVTVSGGATGVLDLSGNPLASDSTWTFTTEAGPQCPCTIFPSSATPAIVTDNDPNPVELGVKFRSDMDGVITGVRFFKGAQNSGTHTGSLWSSTGQLLARVTFTGETSAGWQQMLFSQPVPVTANTTYVVSYHTTSGFYSANTNYFTSGVTREPLYAFSSAESGGNGVYMYSPTPTFPTNTYNSTNYWVDVVFMTSGGPDTTPPAVVSIDPEANESDVNVSTNVTATFSEPVNASTVTTSTFVLRDSQGGVVNGAVSYDAATRTATLNPASNLAAGQTYTVTISGGPAGVADTAGNRMVNDFTWTFTTAAPVVDTTPPTVTSTSPQSGATAVAVDANITVTFNEPVEPATVSASTFSVKTAGGASVPAAVTYNAATRTATLNPDANLAFATSYTVTVVGGASGVKDLAGNALAADHVWSFTTASDIGCPCTIWPANATPAVAAKNDTGAVEVGVRFSSNTSGTITGIRFYKGTGNTGTHTGSLWSSTGQLLARATFTNETATGWQQVLFTTPVQITANTVYIASYHAPAGRYAINENYFTSAIVNGPLQALQSTGSAGNGVYTYSSTPAFPTQSWAASNYWVDVVFMAGGGGNPPGDTTPPTVTSVTPAANATNVALNTMVTATFSEPMDPATITNSTVTLRNNSGTVITATVTYNAANRVATLDPASDLAANTAYTATVTGGASGVKDVAGNPLASNFTWTFTTVSGGDPPPGPCANPANEIVEENCKPGTPASTWDVSGNGDSSIQGFATDFSVDRGETVRFKIRTTATNYAIDIYRIGYYNGDGARLITTINPTASLPQNQPNCMTEASTGLIDCGNWAESASWAVPEDAVSGVYIARPRRADTGGASHIIFIVRDDAGDSDILFQTSDTTWQAYNSFGGNSLYLGNTSYPAGRAVKVSYNRPFATRGNVVEDSFFNAEYPMIRWLERNGYDVSYFTGIDSDRFGHLIANHNVFMSVGHDEYWSAQQREHVEDARDAGVHLAFFSGNEVYWKTRWEPDLNGNGHRTLVTYKEGTSGEVTCGGKCDPIPTVWTGLWRAGCEFTNADGCRPENALTGQISWFESTRGITVPEAEGKLRFWRNTSIANLSPGQSANLPTGMLGYEWNYEQPQWAQFNPPGRVTISSTTTDGRVHKLSVYKHSSGAIVFGAGTVQWSWGLDSNHDRSGPAADSRVQQMTVNLLADMGVQPVTLQSGLVPATASTDSTPPVSTITSPSSGSSVQPGVPITVSGTATDSGGVVALVEVSFDNGQTWTPANGRGSWSISWTPATSGQVTIRSRAVDDSLNMETPGPGTSITVGGGSNPPGDCPCSVWDPASTPTIASKNDPAAVELGMKFRSTSAGFITGVRFYKGAQNTGTHTASLWAANGQLLARATFTNESPTGWQQVLFDTPVSIQANTTYVVSYHTTSGFYAINEGYFTTQVTRGPLQALDSGTSGGNGVYFYSATPAFPTQSWNASDYWVDVVFVTEVSP